MPVLKPEDLWELEDVPVLVRGLFQRSLLRADKWIPRVKQSAIPELQTYVSRMSQRVFSDYLLGNYNAPSPTVDRVGIKYDGVYKERANQLILKILDIRNVSQRTVELWITRQLREISHFMVAAL